MLKINDLIARDINCKPKQVEAAIALLDNGATVPFIARYRKEATGMLDDIQLRKLEERLNYLRELEQRKIAILKSITEQEKLTPELQGAIENCDSKTHLEDLYLPYKPKRRTKAQIAREAGLQSLADQIYLDHSLSPEKTAEAYIDSDAGIADIKAALDGARHIIVEQLAEQADLINKARTFLQANAELRTTVIKGKEQEAQKFKDYFDFQEKISKIPSHRALAMFRGRNEGFLNMELIVAHDEDVEHPCEVMVREYAGITNKQAPAFKWLSQCAKWAWKIKIGSQLETELKGDLKAAADTEAVKVFAQNLKDLLLAAPAGSRATIGLDPGLRTGVKVAVISATGALLETTTIYPHAPRNDWDQSIETLAKLSDKHNAELIAIGNGTASRETDKLAGDLIKRHPKLSMKKVIVSESGASIYSASEFASKELPDVDVSLRGAASIARRLQDPLAELVKIDPKSIGVGQYQHDVNQTLLGKSLDIVVEDCVNAVGVELNTASAPLLSYVAGLSSTVADNIVKFREENGGFQSRKELKKVTRLGPKVFEQCAGFLRIRGAKNPLDASAVHPESYATVEAIAKSKGCNISALIGDESLEKQIDLQEFVSEKTGVITLKDILAELQKPGRDPRPEFKTAEFKEGVEKISDLKPNMVLQGVISNVTNFGAFVDIGVHQDGLVHVSQLANKFVSDPHAVVKAGEVVTVKVVEVDAQRKRISLTMRLDEKAKPLSNNKNQPEPAGKRNPKGNSRNQSQPLTALADAFKQAKSGR